MVIAIEIDETTIKSQKKSLGSVRTHRSAIVSHSRVPGQSPVSVHDLLISSVDTNEVLLQRAKQVQ